MSVNGKGVGSGSQVVVIGGGPAGSTVATLLAQMGVRVRLLERDRFPRFHIGESLMPETYWVLRRLGALDRLKASTFVRKYSVQFVDETGQESPPFYFFENNPHECSQTWQVLRGEFDQLLLDNARAQGVDVRPGVRVRDVLFDGDRASGVRLQDESGGQAELRADVVVDASGQSSLIANRLKLRQPDPFLKKAALWTYYEEAHRDPGLDEGAALILDTAGKTGWFWYIPLHNNLVSVGVIASLDYLFKGRGDLETIYHEELDRCPAVRKRVAGGRRAKGYYAAKDFSYHASRVAGDGWVLVGDALGFLDPLYCSGVFLALKSGELAADAIAEGLARGDISGAQLGSWESGFARAMERLKHLMELFYRGCSFSQFLRRHPEYTRHLTDLLAGDLFKDGVDEVFGPMEAWQRETGVVACTA